MPENIAPIALFVYNRPALTRRTIRALQENNHATPSKLFIFADGAKHKEDAAAVEEVRNYVKSVQGFENIYIIEREKNWGLADNIVDGVTNLVNEYGKIIVLEDDVVTSRHFLRFMNEALNCYEKEEKVWHISGWNYPITTKGLPDTFLWRFMNCWGWGTWADRWQHFTRDPQFFVDMFSEEDIKQFNLDAACNAWEQLLANLNGDINTWAVFWYATIFRHKGLCLNPAKTLTSNIGHDKSGTHCKKKRIRQNKVATNTPRLRMQPLTENQEALSRIKKQLFKSRPSPLRQFAGRIKRSLLHTPAS